MNGNLYERVRKELIKYQLVSILFPCCIQVHRMTFILGYGDFPKDLELGSKKRLSLCYKFMARIIGCVGFIYSY